jgi:hypothetical protein
MAWKYGTLGYPKHQIVSVLWCGSSWESRGVPYSNLTWPLNIPWFFGWLYH